MADMEMKKIIDLKAASYNPRKIDEKELKKLVRSIEEFGFVEPVVINKDGTIIGGHQRVKAAERLGMTEVPVIEVDLPKGKEKALNLALNRISGEFDEEMLSALLSELDEEEKMLSGFDEKEIEKALNVAVEEDDFDATPPTEPKSKLGQVYALGDHRLMCGDATKKEDVEKLMDGEKADMVFTDPPYGVNYEGGHNKKKRSGIENDELQGVDITSLFHDSVANAIGVSKDHSAFYIWYSTNKSVETFVAFSGIGLELRAVIQWYKIQSGLGAFMSQYIPNCEPCIYAFKNGCTPQWFGKSDEKTVWELQRQGKSEFHPTQKPIELCARAISNSSKNDDVILDLFGGSGSTLIACEQTGRKCYMSELDPKYVDVIIDRWEKFTGKKAELL